MEDWEKAIRIPQFSGKKDDWLIWANKFLSKATMRGYDEVMEEKLLATGDFEEDGAMKKLANNEKKADDLNKKAYNELIL